MPSDNGPYGNFRAGWVTGSALKGGAAWGISAGLSEAFGERNAHLALAILNVLNALLYVINYYTAAGQPPVEPEAKRTVIVLTGDEKTLEQMIIGKSTKTGTEALDLKQKVFDECMLRPNPV